MAEEKKSSGLPPFPQEAIDQLAALEHCLNDVHSRLESQRQSKYVTRFTEKNLLTHKCMNSYDKWRKTHFSWMKEICHSGKDQDLCKRMNDAYEAKDSEVRGNILNVYKFANDEEDRGYRELLARVEVGSNLIEVKCPFKSQLGEKTAEKISEAMYNPKEVK